MIFALIISSSLFSLISFYATIEIGLSFELGFSEKFFARFSVYTEIGF